MASGQTRSVHRLSPLLRRSNMHVPLVVDADGHRQEPEEGLAQWMPKELASRGPRRVTDNLGQPRVLIEGRVWDSELRESAKMVAGTPGLSQVRLKLALGPT